MTEDEDAVRALADRVRPAAAVQHRAQLEANTEYYVRVRAQTRPRVTWVLFWPWEHGAHDRRRAASRSSSERQLSGSWQLA